MVISKAIVTPDPHPGASAALADGAPGCPGTSAETGNPVNKRRHCRCATPHNPHGSAWSVCILIGLSMVIGTLSGCASSVPSGNSKAVDPILMGTGVQSKAVMSMDFPPPPGAFTGEGRESRGLWRDLDSAVSTAMTECGLGLVQQIDEPEASSALWKGRRIYQFTSMRDTPVWLLVEWKGVDARSQIEAGRTGQEFVWRCRAGAGQGSETDRAFERRFLEVAANRLNGLMRTERGAK